MAFNKSADQDVIDDRDAAPAAKRRNQHQKSSSLRRAADAFAEQQMLHEAGITESDIYDG